MSDNQAAAAVSRKYLTRVVAAIGCIALLSLALAAPTKFVTMKPGPAFNTLGTFEGKPMFTFGKGVKTYPTTGGLDFTTVRVSQSQARPSVAEVIQAYLFTPDTNVVPRSMVYPEGVTNEQTREASAAQLAASKDSSRVAALRAAGYTVGEAPKIGEVDKAGPAASVLKANDIVLEVDGAEVVKPEDVVKLVQDRKPGDRVRLAVERNDTRLDVDLISESSPDDESKPRVGISITTEYDFPIVIDNNVGDSIGGPSAGSMFALAIYDKLTPGSLTGGLKVAGTGEVTADGVVGSIGGVQQKISGASSNGATVFLVPQDNCAEAIEGNTYGMKIVKMATLDDAISALEKLAANPKAKVPSCR